MSFITEHIHSNNKYNHGDNVASFYWWQALPQGHVQGNENPMYATFGASSVKYVCR